MCEQRGITMDARTEHRCRQRCPTHPLVRRCQVTSSEHAVMMRKIRIQLLDSICLYRRFMGKGVSLFAIDVPTRCILRFLCPPSVRFASSLMHSCVVVDRRAALFLRLQSCFTTNGEHWCIGKASSFIRSSLHSNVAQKRNSS